MISLVEWPSNILANRCTDRLMEYGTQVSLSMEKSSTLEMEFATICLVVLLLVKHQHLTNFCRPAHQNY